MNKVELQEVVGGALQEKFDKAFQRVVENLQDPNTSFKVKRKITIQLDFVQNEARDDVHVEINVVDKLAPQAPMQTAFSIGKDLRTGEVYAEEYGKQIKGQMNIGDLKTEEKVDSETEEVVSNEEKGTVVNFRKAAN